MLCRPNNRHFQCLVNKQKLSECCVMVFHLVPEFFYLRLWSHLLRKYFKTLFLLRDLIKRSEKNTGNYLQDYLVPQWTSKDIKIIINYL